MELVPPEMDQDPQIQIQPRKSSRDKKKPERMTFTSTSIPSLCFAMFNLYDEPKLNIPKLDTYKPIEMHPIQEQSYVTFAYNCRIDAYNQQEEAKNQKETFLGTSSIYLSIRYFNKGSLQSSN